MSALLTVRKATRESLCKRARAVGKTQQVHWLSERTRGVEILHEESSDGDPEQPQHGVAVA